MKYIISAFIFVILSSGTQLPNPVIFNVKHDLILVRNLHALWHTILHSILNTKHIQCTKVGRCVTVYIQQQENRRAIISFSYAGYAKYCYETILRPVSRGRDYFHLYLIHCSSYWCYK